MRNLKNYLLLLCLGIFATACMSDDNDSPTIDDTTMCDIVSFVGNPQSNNNRSVFQFQKEGDSRLTTLRANNIALDTTSTKVNTRVMLYYTPESGMHNVDDNVTVKSIAQVFNDSVRTGDVTKLPDWDYNPIYVNAIWRSGTYLNINCGLTYSYEPSAFMLMVDATTVDNPYPDLYLTYHKGDDRESFFKNFYASIDISRIWNKSTCKGFTLHVNDSNFGNNEITFKKTTLTPMQ